MFGERFRFVTYNNLDTGVEEQRIFNMRGEVVDPSVFERKFPVPILSDEVYHWLESASANDQLKISINLADTRI